MISGIYSYTLIKRWKTWTLLSKWIKNTLINQNCCWIKISICLRSERFHLHPATFGNAIYIAKRRRCCQSYNTFQATLSSAISTPATFTISVQLSDSVKSPLTNLLLIINERCNMFRHVTLYGTVFMVFILLLITVVI